jgi:AraC family transcriptional regulator, positive regulator of tynA and feaB
VAVDTWTAATSPAAGRYAAWQDALDQSHLEWALSPQRDTDFDAEIGKRLLDGIRIIDCYCDPCIGVRRAPQMRRSDGAYFGILFELQGREAVRQRGSEAVLEPGDFVMWDSEQEMEFRVIDRLHKLTLLIPKARMRSVLPQAERYAGLVVRGGGLAGGIAADVLNRLAREFVSLDENEASAVIDPVLNLLGAVLSVNNSGARQAPAYKNDFDRFARYIERNLADVTLAPQSIADAHSVSLRYVHSIFAKEGTSVGTWMRQRRLSHCRRELLQSKQGQTITEIAFRWGFNDAAHFSRVFKAQYGLSPRQLTRAGPIGENTPPVPVCG